jgi:hypothetical protein
MDRAVARIGRGIPVATLSGRESPIHASGGSDGEVGRISVPPTCRPWIFGEGVVNTATIGISVAAPSIDK